MIEPDALVRLVVPRLRVAILMIPLVVTVLAVALAALLLDRLARWMEGRGWIYYRRRRGSSGALGDAFLEVQSLVEPGQRAVLEARRETGDESAESGEPPER